MPLIIESDDLEHASALKQSKLRRIWRKLHRKYPFQSPIYSLPEPWQCKVHLKLMKTFARLYRTVNDSTHASDQRPHAQNGSTESRTHEQVWHVYVSRAAQRFAKWWSTMVTKDADDYLQQVKMSVLLEPGALEASLRDIKPMNWTETELPPIDVIMVLHTFMLNPRFFLEDCIRFNMLPLWKAGMPWKLLDTVIDPVTFEYQVSTSAKSTWTNETRIPWNNDLWYQDWPNHDQKRISKFHRAVRSLRTKDVPMRGTVLDASGVAKSAEGPGQDPEMFIMNRLLQGELGQKLLEETAWDRVRQNISPSLDDVQVQIEAALQHHPQRLAKIAVKRTMAQFRQTHSVFALELAPAVERQRVFVQKMEETDWLHSPALDYTLETLIQRYEIFFKIMEKHKNRVAVPTIAVDLAWHTHQLSPSSYYYFSLANAGNVFIDHDDKIGEAVLTDAFDWTCQQYSSLANCDDYGQCLCWYCATVLRELDGKTDNLNHDEHGHVVLGNKAPLYHKVMKKIATSQYAKLEEDFAFETHRAEKSKSPFPDQESFLKSYIWPYPQAIPAVNV